MFNHLGKWFGSFMLFVMVGGFLGGVYFVQTLVKNADKPDPCAQGACTRFDDVKLKRLEDGTSTMYPFTVGDKVQMATILAKTPQGTQLEVTCSSDKAIVVSANNGTNFQIGTTSPVEIDCTAKVTNWTKFWPKEVGLIVTLYNK